MSAIKRKTTSVSLTIVSPVHEVSNGYVARPSFSTLVQPLSMDLQRMSSPCSSLSGSICGIPPIFTKPLQDITATKGQFVVFECRVQTQGGVHEVHWYKGEEQIIDSDDFRILRKKACLSAVPEEVCTLVMTEVFPEDTGEFKCIVENEAGATSSSAWLFVSPGEEMEKSEDPQTTPKGQDFLKPTSCFWTRESLAKERDTDTKLPIDEESSIPKEDNHFLKDNSSELSLHWDSILQERAESRPTSISSPELIKLCSDSFQTPDFSSSPPITPGTSLPGSNNNCNNSSSNPSKYQPTMFNYERPKHFIQPQNTCSSRLQPPGPETSTFSTSQTKQSSILIHPRQCTEQRYSASSTVSSQITVSSSAFPASGQQLSGSFPGHKVTSTYNQSPASFLSSVLPSQPDYSSSKTPTAVESNYQQPSVNQPINAKPAQSAHPKLIPKTPDHEIQGSKEALIQDLERKLRCKDNLLHNGNQRLTYEEKMARRLLGPQNAAAVFQAQNDSESQNSAQHNSENARLQVPTPQIRSRSSSRGDTNDQESILEKFYPPRFVQVPENISMEEGRFCRIDFKVSGLPAPDVTWYLNGRPVQSDELHKMIVSEKGFHSLIFEVVRTSDAGTYACVAKNRAGEATFTIQLDVLAKEHKRAPMFIYKPQSKKVYEGDSVKLECQVSAIPPPKLFWKRNNEMVQFNTDRISLYHDNSGRITLLIKDANKKDAGWYTVSAVNEAGVVTCNTRLDVAARPTQTLPNPKQLRVRPTFSKYLALNGKGLDVKQAFNPEGEFQRLAAQSGLYESEEL